MQLFEKVNGRRPYEYSDSERIEIGQMIDAIISQQPYPWQDDALVGRWILVYLESGPQGGGVDRRIPFPEFSFNDSYQTFTQNSVENVGELLGPFVWEVVYKLNRQQQ